MSDEYFDWKIYIDKYPDLKKAGINNKQKAYKHWHEFGKRENRNCDIFGFDWEFYTKQYPDIHSLTYEQAQQHWIKYGINDERIACKELINYTKTDHFDQSKYQFDAQSEYKNYDNIDTSKINLFYYVNNTCTLNYNSGIQKLVKLLGKKLMNKCNLYLIKFDFNTNTFINLSINDKINLQKFNGIPDNNNQICLNIENKWLLIPELDIRNNNLKILYDEAIRNAMKIAIIFYDDIPYIYPQFYSHKGRYQTILNILTMSRSNLIFPISLYSYSRLLFHYEKLNMKEISKKIIPILISPEFPDIARNNKYFLNIDDINEYKILCVSSADHRKNINKLIEAIKILKIKTKLILIGSGILNKFKTNNNIICYENISYEELHKFYLESHITVFPSIEEGYGLPIAESIWNCRPCICMNYGSMAEIAVAGCIKIDCNNIQLLANSIENVLTNKSLYNELIEQMKNVQIKSWQNYANEIIYEITKYDTMSN